MRGGPDFRVTGGALSVPAWGCQGVPLGEHPASDIPLYLQFIVTIDGGIGGVTS